MENNEQQNYAISKPLLVLNVIFVISILLMIFIIYTSSKKPGESARSTEKIAAPTPFEKVALDAKAAYVFDVSGNKVLFQKNQFAQLPLASVTKLMMALVATDLLPKNSRLTIKKEFLEGEGDTGLLPGESWKLGDLIDFSLVVSSNDGARSIASVVGAFDLKSQDYTLGRKDFVEKMNLKAQDLGLKQTYYINESGLDEGLSSGGYGSAIDTAKLMQFILINRPDILEATKYQVLNISSLNKTHSAKNTNIDINTVPGLIASKTGYTDVAGGNLVVAFDSSIGKPIIVVVLGSTEKGRFFDVSNLVRASINYITNN